MAGSVPQTCSLARTRVRNGGRATSAGAGRLG